MKSMEGALALVVAGGSIVDSDGKTCMAEGWNPLEASSPASLAPGLDSETELPCKECLENQLCKRPEQKMQDFFRLHANL